MTALIFLAERIGSPLLGIFLPAIIFVFSFWVVWVLFKRFTREGKH
jgi:lipopolysaccharide export LptBFGC system permease protein LptF